MKKKLLSVLAVAAGLLMATSCSNEREEVKTEGEAVVSFVAELPPSMVNRAPKGYADATTFGDGSGATHLQYHVYKVTDDAWTPIEDLAGTATFVDLKTTVSLKLVNGNKYAVAFWADATTADNASIYTFDEATCSVTANYDGVESSNESLDAFYAVKEFTVNGSSQETVELYRPFAQLNIGTADLEESAKAGQEIAEAGITVKTYNTLSLKDGAVSGEAEITFAKAALPEANFPVVGGYKYLAMNYLLMPADKKADNTVTIRYDNENVPERVFYNVPLQRNYRTNIYGNLLTSTTEFNVIIKPEFVDPDNDVEVWDGVTKTEPQEVNGAYIVTKAAEWAWLGEQSRINKSITITEDIDFGGNAVKAIGLTDGTVQNIKPVIDGQNHTLSNLTVTAAEALVVPGTNAGGHYACALFVGANYAPQLTIKDLTVKNIKVDCPNSDNGGNISGYAAAILADVQAAKVSITNVHVDGAEIKGVQGVGGIVGIVPQNREVTVSGCSVKNAALSNYAVADESGFVASVIGRVAGTATISSSTIENNTIDAYYTVHRGEAGVTAVAGVDTSKDGTLTDDTTVPASVTVNKTLFE